MKHTLNTMNILRHIITIKKIYARRIYIGLPHWLNGKEYACNAGELQEMGDQCLIPEDPLEEETGWHYSALVWEMLWAEEPGRLHSMGLQKSETQLSS